MRAPILLFVLALTALASAQAIEIPVPEGNRAELTEAPRRPGPGDVEAKARTLFAAIKADDVQATMPFFLSREVFRAVKGIADPDGLYDRIIGMYERDIHELHEELGADRERAEFVRFEFSRRRGWVEVRQESNRLPYWAQRHNHIVYRVGDEERRFEVRTMISWGDEWFITHLSEFRR